MEIKKIVNLLNGFNNELSNFRQKSGTIKTVQTMMKVTLMVQALDARQKKTKKQIKSLSLFRCIYSCNG